MKRVLALVIAMAVMLGVAGNAAANNPQFLWATSSVNPDNGNFTVSWKETGLGNQRVTYSVQASAYIEYKCYNKQGKNPPADNKHFADMVYSNTATYTANKNGEVTKSLTLYPQLPNNWSCPKGFQIPKLEEVSYYAGATITDVTNGITITVTGGYWHR